MKEREQPDVDRPDRPQPLDLGWTGTPPGAKMPFGYPGRLHATPGWCNAGLAIEAILGRIVLCEDVTDHPGPHFSNKADFVPGWSPYEEWNDGDMDAFRLRPPP